MKLCLVIPAHNEAKTIGPVLDGVFNLGRKEWEVLVVDDGSSDQTAEIARSKGAVVVRHMINRGLGGALGTGIQAGLLRGADIIVTFDADGQHAPQDIQRVILPLINQEADVVIGSRMLGDKGMPWYRKIANGLANGVTWMFFGVQTTDSQSGLRAFSRKAAEQIRIVSNTYEISSEICGEIGRLRLKLAEVPIQPIYTDYSLSKGQSFSMGIKTLIRMLFSLGGK